MRLIENYLPPVLEDGIRTAKALGYGTGAGSSVTQTTSRATGVTINALSGTITTDSTSLAAEASAKFTVTNSKVEIGDVWFVQYEVAQLHLILT